MSRPCRTLNLLFTFSHPAGDEVRARHTVEGGLDLGGYGLGQAGFPRPRGSVQQDSLPGFYTSCPKEITKIICSTKYYM